MRLRLLYVCSIALALLITVAIASSCAQPAPTLIPANTPAPPAPSPPSNVDTPAYKDSEVIGIAGNQPDVKSLYAAAETTKDYKFPEVKDFNWSAQYLGSGRWYVTLSYTQWDYNLNGYLARTKNWFFDEAKGALTPTG